MKKCLLGLISIAVLAGCGSDSNKVPEVSGVFSGVTYSEVGTPIKVTATAINLADSESANNASYQTIVTLWDERDVQVSYSGRYHQASNKLTFANEQYECIPDNNQWRCVSAVDNFTLSKTTPKAVNMDVLLGRYSAQSEFDSYRVVITADEQMTILGTGCEASGSLSYALDEQVLMFELADNDCDFDTRIGIMSYVSDNDELFSLEFQTVDETLPIIWIKQ